MSAYFFRVLDEHGAPNGYIGFAYAKTKTELFWLIDEFCDPYSCQIATANKAGFCVLVEDADDEVYSEHEFSESFSPVRAHQWKTPDWSDVVFNAGVAS